MFLCFSGNFLGDVVSWGERGSIKLLLVGMGLYVECFVIGSYVLLLVMLDGIKLIEGFDLGGVLKQNVLLQGTRDI